MGGEHLKGRVDSDTYCHIDSSFTVMDNKHFSPSASEAGLINQSAAFDRDLGLC